MSPGPQPIVILSLQKKEVRGNIFFTLMKLKCLELIGFKSFVDKTVVTFEKDITGVVGPNGCGKSNIVDAIRWVMGEQSPRLLRGKQMEDVIFNGSDNRSPLSMASVELTFSTEGYHTPAAYLNHPEISICRRIYRSGESEYFINKTPVRLKDILELFLGTGVGTRAYSMIEQGKVYQFLTAKPEERRHYLEEAAGISKFKVRKEAALRKMESTQQNVVRLNDLVTELERQITSLDRQAKKAEKYRELKTEFQKWDLAVLSYSYVESSKLQEELEKNLRLYSTDEITVQKELTEGENNIELSRLSLADLEKEINQIQGDLFQLTNTIQLTENSLRYKNEERARLQARMTEVQVRLASLQSQLLKTHQELTRANEQRVLADLDREELLENLGSLQSGVEGSQNRISGIRTSLEKIKEEIHLSERCLLQIETLRANAIQKQAELEKHIQNSEEELKKLERMYQETQKIYRLAYELLESLKQMKFNLSQKTDQLGVELTSHRDNLKKEETELTQLRETLTQRKSRLNSLEELQKNFEGYQEGTRSVLKRRQETGGEGIFGTVADFVETAPEYEGAVSAVLGEKLQYVVVKNHAQGLEAVEYLKTAETGRSSFIPLHFREKGIEDSRMPEREGVLGPLQRFVNVKQEYEKLGEFLFGDVVLVKDLKNALDIWSANGYRKTLVTLGGEVVDPTGVITGGSLASTSKTLLSMKREMKELGGLVGKLEAELKEKAEIRLRLSVHVEEMTESLNTLKKSSHEEELKIANQGNDVAQFKKELDSLTHKKQELSNSLLAKKESLSFLVEDLRQMDLEESQLREKLKVYQETHLREKAEMDLLLGSSESEVQALTQRKVELAQAQERLLRLSEESDRMLEESIRLRMDLVRGEEEEELILERAQFLEKDAAHLQKVISKRLEAREEIQKKFTVRRETYEEEARKIRDREFSLKEMRRSYEEVSKNLNQVTVTLTEVRGTLKHLTEQCLERHQILLSDSYAQYFDENLNRSEAESLVSELKQKLSRIGEVNTGALAEYEELTQRHQFLKTQRDDLQASLDLLERAIHKINRTTREKFITTFNQVNEKFQELFPKLFMGGKANLFLTDENNLLETGVEIMAQPPGKRFQSINLLSGGEKALTAVSLIFSIFLIRPSPFCILDEVDAPLDEANVYRFNELIREMTGRTQFIVITHNKRTMEMTDTLYGVTMQEPGASQLVSVELK